jgi:peptidoglycan/LPS O-acetylase OafA/YrhL
MNSDSSPRRVPELDGLRGLAIFSVVAFHYISQEGIPPAGTIAHVLHRGVIMGWSGVDLFFVLSGFLIGGMLMDARNSPNYYRTFYARRIFRIIPIYYLWITAYIVLVSLAGPKIQALSNSGAASPLGFSTASLYLFLQNIQEPSSLGLAGPWFGHLWSLAVEEQFYLIAPLIVRFVSPKRLPAVLTLVVILAPVLRTIMRLGLGASAWQVTVLMPTRADALAIGFLLAAFFRSSAYETWPAKNLRKLYAALGVLMCGAVALWLWSPTSGGIGMQTIGFSVLGLLYGVILLLALSHTNGSIARLMRIGWLRELGRVSYCVYIIHLVVNVGCHAVLLHKAARISTTGGALVTLLAAAVTYVAARLSWTLIESPLLKKGHTFKY